MSDRLALSNAIEDALVSIAGHGTVAVETSIVRAKAERIASVIIDAIHDNVATKTTCRPPTSDSEAKSWPCVPILLAGAVGANERAVRNWFEAKNGPTGEHLLRLISNSDEMLDSVLAMAGKRDFAAALEIAKAKRALERALAELAKL